MTLPSGLWASWHCEEALDARIDATLAHRDLSIIVPLSGGNIGNAPGIIGNGILWDGFDVGETAGFTVADCPDLGQPFTVSYWHKYQINGSIYSFNCQVNLEDPLVSGKSLYILSEVDDRSFFNIVLLGCSYEGGAPVQVAGMEDHEYWVRVEIDPIEATAKVYVDNILISTLTNLVLSNSSDAAASVSVYGWDPSLTGVAQVMDEIAIFTRILSGAEATYVWNNGNGNSVDNLPPSPAFCTATSMITLNPANMIITGVGTGTDATDWRVIKVAGGAVMDSGSGSSATFAFIGEYDTEYQLQFIGSVGSWSAVNCFFSVAAPIPPGPVPVPLPYPFPSDPPESPTPNPNPSGSAAIRLRYSKDGGYTFGPEKLRSAGALGHYLQRVRWPGNLGRARAPFVEISGEANSRIVIVDSFVEIEQGKY